MLRAAITPTRIALTPKVAIRVTSMENYLQEKVPGSCAEL
jgi:hypothetical protein